MADLALTKVELPEGCFVRILYTGKIGEVIEYIATGPQDPGGSYINFDAWIAWIERTDYDKVKVQMMDGKIETVSAYGGILEVIDLIEYPEVYALIRLRHKEA